MRQVVMATLNYTMKKLKLDYNTILLLLGSCCALMLFFALVPPFNHWTFKSKDLNSSVFADYGQFISGILGSIISLVTIILLYKTLNDQRTQFLMSNFKSNFYSLLENHKKMLDSIGDNVFECYPEEFGADFFCDLAERICIDFEGISREHKVGSENFTLTPSFPNSNAIKNVEKLKSIYGYYYNQYQSDLGHYFRNLYHFVRFIENSQVDGDTKFMHLKILRAQLSIYEILLLAYNGLYYYGEKFKPLIEEYELLKNLNFEINLDNSFHKRIIDAELLITEYPHLKITYEKQIKLLEMEKLTDNKGHVLN
jgi:Putative phage abortive infection protein